MVRAHGTPPTDLSPHHTANTMAAIVAQALRERRPFPDPCAVLAAEIERVALPAARAGETSAVIYVPLVLVDDVAAVAEQLDFQVTVYQRVPWLHADLPSGWLRLEWPGAAVITPPFGRPAAPFAGPRRGAPDPDWRYRWGLPVGSP